MITLHSRTSSGYITHHVAASNIARITEAGKSNQWHGIRAIVKLFDGDVLEVEETASAILAMVNQEEAKQCST